MHTCAAAQATLTVIAREVYLLRLSKNRSTPDFNRNFDYRRALYFAPVRCLAQHLIAMTLFQTAVYNLFSTLVSMDHHYIAFLISSLGTFMLTTVDCRTYVFFEFVRQQQICTATNLNENKAQ